MTRPWPHRALDARAVDTQSVRGMVNVPYGEGYDDSSSAEFLPARAAKSLLFIGLGMEKTLRTDRGAKD